MFFKKKRQPTFAPTKRHWAIAAIGTGEERDYLIDNLALLLSSGMDIIAALAAIKAELRSTFLKKIIDEINEDISSGFSLGQALEKTNLFPRHIVSLVLIGEQSGRLHESLRVIVEQQEKARDFRAKIRAAMMYPVLVIGVAGVVAIGIAWFILPRLAVVFTQLNLTLPLITRVLITFGTFLAARGTWVVPLFVVVIIILFYFLFLFRRTKWIGQKIVFIIPGIKTLVKQVELARFGYIMGTLLKGGLPVVEALGSLEQASPLFDYRKLYQHLKERVEEGESFEQAFSEFKRIKRYIPVPVQGLIVAGEQSGRLSAIFTKVAENYEGKTEITTKNLNVILEPILLVMVWLGVVGVALAVILPIYSLVGGINSTSGSQNARPVARPVPVAPVSTTTATTIPAVKLSPASLQILPTGDGYLNVRSGPSAKTPIINRASEGKIFSYTTSQNGWYKISLNNFDSGWVSANYVRVSNH